MANRQHAFLAIVLAWATQLSLKSGARAEPVTLLPDDVLGAIENVSLHAPDQVE